MDFDLVLSQFVPILLVLSTSSMLLLDQRTLQIKYRVPAAEIYRLSLSPYLDDIAVFHIKAVSMRVYYFLVIAGLNTVVFIMFHYYLALIINQSLIQCMFKKLLFIHLIQNRLLPMFIVYQYLFNLHNKT